MENRLVSVIIPVHNSEKTIYKCVESVLKQTYGNLEILIIFNDSTDESKRIVNKFKDNRIKIFNEKKANVSKARNIGIDESNGKYIMFVDADDYLEINAINDLIEIEKKNNDLYDIIVFNYYKCLKNKKVEEKINYQVKELDKQIISEKFIPDLIATNIWGSVWRLFIKNKCIKDKIRFKENVSIAEDLLFNIELFNDVEKIYLFEKCLYNYLVSSCSTLNKYKTNNMQINQEFHKELIKILKKERIYDSNIYSYKKNRIVMYTSSISNAVRNRKFFDAIKEIKNIISIYNNDEFDYNDVEMNLLIKFTFMLLDNCNYYLLYFFYKIKEILRYKKCRRK